MSLDIGLDALTLQDVESLVSPHVFLRARDSHVRGAVLDLNRAGQRLVARVAEGGASHHQVTISANDSGIDETDCTCSYARDMGLTCKHAIAALLRWIEVRPGLPPPTPTRGAELSRLAAGRREASPFALLSPGPEAPVFSLGGAATRPPPRTQDLPRPPSPPPARVGAPSPPPAPAAARRRPPGPGRALVEGHFHRAGLESQVDFDREGPSLAVRLREPGTHRSATLVYPAAEVPAVLRDLRGRGGLRWTSAARTVRIYKRAAIPELHADFDARERLVLKPVWRLPRLKGKERCLSPAELAKGRVSLEWFWDGKAFFPLAQVPRALRAEFEYAEPRTLEADEIPEWLFGRRAELQGEGGFRPSPAVARARVTTARLRGVGLRRAAEGWFKLDPRYEAAGHALTLNQLLRREGGSRYLRRGEDWIVLPNDPLVELARRRPAPPADGTIDVAPLDFLRLRARWEDGVRLEVEPGSGDLGPLLAGLERSSPPAPAPPPPGLVGELRPYQRAGYEWLWFLRRSGLHAVLADDMGLGKTHQTLALLLAAHAEGSARRTLVVCPTSVLDHWERKLREHAPSLAPYLFHGPRRGSGLPPAAEHPVVLTTYSILTREADALAKEKWEVVVLDEAQKIKNGKTQMARAAKRLDARFRLALTGTPIENRLSELWSLFDFMLPSYLGTEREFRERFETPIARQGEREPQRVLRRLIHPFKLRRLKSEVLSELPSKVEDLRYCSLAPAQAALYRSALENEGESLLAGLRDEERRIDYLHILAVLTRLKQICDHPALVLDTPGSRALPSGKFELFREILEEALDSGQKVVVFSQYLGMLDLIEEHLRRLGVNWSGLRGATRDRAQAIRRFQNSPDCRVFAGSLLAGGLGIDLTAASVVIHYDRWWNAAREEQATDRVHRIGQTRGVQVIKLITQGTLEEKIDAMIRAKRELMDQVVQADEDVVKSLTRGDLIELLTFAGARRSPSGQGPPASR
ncbi:MAG: DEAD/DEAH box helicase [Planctomycetes bacterium]|nr:DEAD/DEAH box helicase [Planctomycetota bacterium]